MLWTVQWDHEMSENYWIFHKNLILTDRIRLLSFFLFIVWHDSLLCNIFAYHILFWYYSLFNVTFSRKESTFIFNKVFFMQKHLAVDRLQSILSCCKHFWVQKTVKLFELSYDKKMDMGGKSLLCYFKKIILEKIFNDWRTTFDGFMKYMITGSFLSLTSNII